MFGNEFANRFRRTRWRRVEEKEKGQASKEAPGKLRSPLLRPSLLKQPYRASKLFDRDLVREPSFILQLSSFRIPPTPAMVPQNEAFQ